MRRHARLAVATAVLLGLLVGGCTSTSQATEARFSSGGSDYIYAVTDNETGVEYMVVHNAIRGNVAVTPLLDVNGMPKVSNGRSR